MHISSHTHSITPSLFTCTHPPTHPRDRHILLIHPINTPPNISTSVHPLPPLFAITGHRYSWHQPFPPPARCFSVRCQHPPRTVLRYYLLTSLAYPLSSYQTVVPPAGSNISDKPTSLPTFAHTRLPTFLPTLLRIPTYNTSSHAPLHNLLSSLSHPLDIRTPTPSQLFLEVTDLRGRVDSIQHTLCDMSMGSATTTTTRNRSRSSSAATAAASSAEVEKRKWEAIKSSLLQVIEMR